MAGFLERLELRTNRAYWSDGLLDLFCGFAVLAIGVSWVTKQATFGGIVPALIVPLWGPLRRRFTEPRMGSVELGEPRQRRNRGFVGLMLAAGVLSFLAGVVAFLSFDSGMDLSLSVVKGFPGMIVGIAGIAAAEALQVRRFFLYGSITMAGALIVGLVEPLNPGWAFVAGGTAALAGGTLLAIRFVRRHPGTETTGDHG